MKRISTLIACIGFCLIGLAQTPQLLKNINTATTDVFSSSFPKKGMACNNVYLFPATDYNGSELWRTDGTGANTQLIKDLAAIFDRQDADPRLFIRTGDSLYFFTLNGFHLYKYKPSTNKITQVSSGKEEAWSPTEAVIIGNDIFFAGDWYFNQGVELLRYNIINNSMSIYDINPDEDSSLPHNLTVKGDSLFFAANDGTNGVELWLYDATTDDVQMVKNINGTGSSNPSDLVIYNGKVFFTASNGINGNELWSSDGNPINTTMFADINTNNSVADSSNPDHKTVFNGKLYFSATNGTDGIELWVADDNTTTAEQLVDINTSGDSNPGKYGFKQAGSLLYFAADNGDDGMELWKTDGTDTGTEIVSNIHPFDSSNPMDMYSLSDTLIFVANDGNGFELWRTNGTSTAMIQNIQPPSADTIHISGVYNNYVYFGADNGTTGVELWKTDGTSANTSLVKDINLGAAISSDPLWFEKYNGEMYFGSHPTTSYQWSLFKTDGSVGNATELKAGGGATDFSVSYEHGRKAGSYFYFTGYTSADGNELWKSDGTTGGTVEVKDINPGAAESSPANMIEMGSLLIFVANDGVNGRELWKSDGTAGGTVLIKNINPTGNSDIRDMRLVNGKVCFVANDGTTGDELWVTDGTTGGTIQLKNINGAATASDVFNLYVSGTKLYFSANDGTNGNELWVTDGTPVNTVLLKNIEPGNNSSNPGWFAELGSWVYFSASNALWRTDGTAANTSQFYNVTFPFLLTNVGSKIVFIALPAGSTNGFHIWSTDGTIGGTNEIEDFMPGEVGLFLLDEFPSYNGKAFFWIDDGISGQELWQSDGTAAGTIMFDIAAGPHSSYPRSARGLNPLIFSADDGTITGREVWRLDVTNTLPVTGLEFNATKQSNKTLLEWKTFSEINNKGFHVLRSSNGVQFDSIGFVAAKGINGDGANYNFTDANPVTGKNYYRLKQIDLDGKINYSQLRWVDFSKDGFVKGYPNPAREILYINTGYTFRDAIMNIRSMNGQLVKQMKINGAGTISIPVKDLPAGVYNIEIAQPGQTVKLIFVKQ